MDSGGGTSVTVARGQRPVLLDLYLRDPAFTDTSTFSSRPRGCGGTANRLGYGRFDIHNEPAFVLVKRRLALWKSSSPALIESIEQTIEHTFYLFVLGNLPLIERFHLPEGFDRRQVRLETIVLYDKSYGAIFSDRLYSRLGDRSKAGLIIHEALRQIQIAYDDRMSEKSLQEATARILMDQPQSGETLDDPARYGDYLKDLIASSPAYFRRKQAELCKPISRLIEFSNHAPEAMSLEAVICRENDVPQNQASWFYEAFNLIEANFGTLRLRVSSEAQPDLADLYRKAWTRYNHEIMGIFQADAPQLYSIDHQLAQFRSFGNDDAYQSAREISGCAN